jgi:transglutaminase-like putative cysteine protease
MNRTFILMALLDGIAVVALLSSREVFLPVLMSSALMATAAVALLWHRRGRAAPPWLSVTAIALALVTAVLLISRLRIHPVDAAANAALLVHAALLLSGNGLRARQTRVAYSFLEIVLAAALNPEARTAVLIFVYFAAASQLLTLNYLERTAPGLPRAAVARMLRFSLASALITFLVSLATAPLLPKLRQGLGTGAMDYFPQLTPGYSETVDMAAFGSWGPGGDAPALRLIPPRNTPLELLAQALPRRLLRGRVLERFDGSRWVPVPAAVVPPQAADPGALVLEIQREATGSHGIPVPYGTHAVLPAPDGDSFGQRHVFQLRQSGDWMSLGTGMKRLRYLAALRPEMALTSAPRDQPSAETSLLPPSWKNAGPQWTKLRAEAFGGHGAVAAKASAAEEYFAQSGLYVGEFPDRTASAGGVKDSFEEFLFKTRRGHCGLFAAAVALLFRQEGIPARVVSGFKIPRIVDGVMTLRSRDAHAWVEVWDGAHGRWIVLDPTPPLPFAVGGALQWWRDAVENATEALWALEDGFSVYWFRAVVKGAEGESNGSSTQGAPSPASLQRFSALENSAGILIAVALSLGLALWFWGRRNREQWREGTPPALKRVRRRLSRAEKNIDAASMARLKVWDERLRFSRLRAEPERWTSELAEFEQEVRRCARAARAAQA